MLQEVVSSSESSNGVGKPQEEDEVGDDIHPLSEAAIRRESVTTTKIGLIPFMTILFFCVCGGAYGTEDVVSAAYPLYAIIGFILIPFVFALPLGLMTAELSTMFPENGGYVVWVRNGLGDFWGFMEGYLSWVNTVTDNALYPAMFSDYLFKATGHPTSMVLTFFIKTCIRLGVLIVITLMALSGLEIVGTLATIFTIFVVLPFIVLVFMGVKDTQPSLWTKTKPLSEIEWSLFLSSLVWNYSGWDSVSTIAGQVKNPKRNFPLGITVDILGVMVLYVTPLLVALSAVQDFDIWKENTYIEVAKEIGGYWLGLWLTVGATISALGIFNGTMITSSWALSAMAEPEMLNWSPLSWVNKRGSPWVSVLINSVSVLFCLFLPFQLLVQFSILPYLIAMLLEVLSLIALRIKKPNLKRPYRIPLNTVGLIILYTPYTLITLMLMISPFISISKSLFFGASMDWEAFSLVVFGTLTIVFGVFLYFLIHWRRTRNMILLTWKKYHGIEYEEDDNILEMETLVYEDGDDDEKALGVDTKEEERVNDGSSDEYMNNTENNDGVTNGHEGIVVELMNDDEDL